MKVTHPSPYSPSSKRNGLNEVVSTKLNTQMDGPGIINKKIQLLQRGQLFGWDIFCKTSEYIEGNGLYVYNEFLTKISIR